MLDFIEKHTNLFSSAGLLIMTGIEFGILNKMCKKALQLDETADSNQEEES